MSGKQGIWQRVKSGLSGVSDGVVRAASGAVAKVREALPGPQTTGAKAPGEPTSAPQTSGPQSVPFANGHVPLDDGQRIYAIGDIHGRADLLDALIGIIEADADGYPGQVGIVFLGDYIDRGFQSRQVIEMLTGERLERFEVCCLKGNHEDAMLTFLGDPEFGPRWAAYGGRETLVSYGVRPPRSMTMGEDWHRAHSDLIHALPREHETFLQKLDHSMQIGPYGFVHAGIRPGVPFEDQKESDLMWIREEFLKSQANSDLIIVHGHTPVDRPFKDHRRINVDTGAYFSGRLTAARLEGDTVTFLTTKT